MAQHAAQHHEELSSVAFKVVGVRLAISTSPRARISVAWRRDKEHLMVEAVDFVVHIPLEAEYAEFRAVFPVIEEIIDDVNVIAYVKAPNNFKVAVIVQETMGRSSALAACTKAMTLFKPRVYICLGIAGALSKDLNLGDVCYTGGLVDVYDNTKVTDVKGGGVDIALAPSFYSTERKITAALGFVRTLTSLGDLYEYWQEDQAEFTRLTITGQVPGRDGTPEDIKTPKCMNGDIVCGAVSESDAYRERLRGITRNILAIETESGPIFETCRDLDIRVLTIRGISDYANASKGKLEGSTKEGVRRIAARNASAFLHMQMQNELFLNSTVRVVDGNAAQPQLDLGDKTDLSIADALEKIAIDTDSKLRELSPSYRTKPLGFRLPFPRVRQELANAVGDPKKRPAEIEFQSAVATHKRLMLYVPRNYPDQALPWMLANGLLQTDIAGKKAIPIVIDGTALSQPRSGLDHLSPIPLTTAIEVSGGEYVFIVNEPPFSNKRQMAFLDTELKKWPGARVLLITRRERAFVEASESFGTLKLDTFSLCDVSFLEIAAFVEASFELPSQEAEVIALKLRDMFKKFALPAHPSFFAGIPSEALAALLLANRRSELIQLAIDGFLSFVVASDTSKPKMSRGNRASFLRRLVVNLIHEKKSYDEAELVAFTKSISDEFDYGLNPIDFIKGFEDAGLLHFEDGKVVLTLPFMASYLFADEMNKAPELASNYLKAVGDEPDLSIFDLYAEIGPSKDAVERTLASLEVAIAEAPGRNEDHILLTAAINPVIFRNPARLSNLSRKVSEARQALADGVSDRNEKARVLDIVDRVSEGVAEGEDTKKAANEPGENDGAQQLMALSKAWTIATILMGSGAESINGADRQHLAEAIIAGAEVFLDLALRNVNSLDFESIKTQILADKQFRTSVGADDDPGYDNVVSAMVDLIEFMALSDPLDRVFDQLPDRAGHPIVGNSVIRAATKSRIQELIRLNWLINIYPRASKGELLKAIHGLPEVHFVRASLTSIYMMRTKWRVPDADTRLALLDAAAEAVKPYNPNLDKGEIMRLVERGQLANDREEEA